MRFSSLSSKSRAFALIAGAGIMAACSSPAPTATTAPVRTPTAAATTAVQTPASTGAAGNTLTIATVGDQIQFDKTSLTASAGSVTVTLQNKAGPSIQHNWVLVKSGTVEQVANAGTAAGPGKGWIPDDPNVIAHTKLVDGGKSDSVTFTAAAGTYDFLCSFPGHYGTMKGTFTVK